MSKKTILVQGLPIAIEQVGATDFISLTDIAKKADQRPDLVLQTWLRNRETVKYLGLWEELHNPDFNPYGFAGIRDRAGENNFYVSISQWIKSVNAVGLRSQPGRYGGTFAHRDIALQFCYWLSPSFQLYFIKEFQRLKDEEAKMQNLEWHIERITDLVDEARNWLDTVPGQKAARNRVLPPEKG